MKLSTAIILSIFAHIVLLLGVTQFHQTQPTKQTEDSLPIVTAQLIFTKPSPKSEPQLEPVTEPVPAKEPATKTKVQPTPEPKAILESNLETSIQQTTTKEQEQQPGQPKLPIANFDPYASLDSFIEQQTTDFIVNSTQAEQQARTNAINNIPETVKSINSSDQSQIKEIFETAQRIDADTRVVNYNGKCVQIKRQLDHNGFSQFKWTGTTLDCGVNKDMKKQLKQSLAKFIK